MQLLLILALLGALLSAEAAPTVAVTDPLRCGLLILVLSAAVALLARMIAGVTDAALRHDFNRRRTVLAHYDRMRQLHMAVWLVVGLAILWGLGWPQVVRQNWHLAHLALASHLLVLLPLVAPLVLSWWAFSLVDARIDAGIAQLCGVASETPSRLARVALQCRHQLGPTLAPLCLVLALRDIAARVWPQSLTAGGNWTVEAAGLVLLLLMFPWLLRHLWQTHPLPEGPLRTQLREVERSLGVDIREILVWQTGSTVCNAAIAGFVPACRYVFLSDGLIERLSNDQIAAVYAHELGHLRHRHMSLRLLAVVLPVVLWQAAAVTCPEALSALSNAIATWGIAPPVQAGAATLLAAGLYAVLVFGWYSRLLEQEADLCGCRVAGMNGALPQDGPLSPNDDSTRDCTEQFVHALAAVTAFSGRPGGGGWLHPTLASRVAFVRHMVEDPLERLRFARRTRRLARMLVVLVVIAGAWPLLVKIF